MTDKDGGFLGGVIASNQTMLKDERLTKLAIAIAQNAYRRGWYGIGAVDVIVGEKYTVIDPNMRINASTAALVNSRLWNFWWDNVMSFTWSFWWDKTALVKQLVSEWKLGVVALIQNPGSQEYRGTFVLRYDQDETRKGNATEVLRKWLQSSLLQNLSI